MVGGEPTGAGVRIFVGLEPDASFGEIGEPARVCGQGQFVRRHGLQHRHRVQELLVGALEFRERRIGATVRPFALARAQATAAVADGLPGSMHIVFEAG